MHDTLLIDTPSVLAAYDEATAELVEGARVMREFATETVAFGDVENGEARVVDFRVSDAEQAKILEEAHGLELAAMILHEMRLAISAA